MGRDYESRSLCDQPLELESAFSTVAALAEYARAANLDRANELLAEVLAFMVTRGSAAHQPE